MADQTTVFQLPIFTNYILPFLLTFVLVYAVLEKIKLLGEKHQINAIVAGVVGIILTGFLAPVLTVQKMVMFMAVALVILFVILVLWGFIWGDEKGFKLPGWMKWILVIIVGIATIIAVLWSTGVLGSLTNILFQQTWSNTFWTNFLFVAIIIVALFFILYQKKKA